MPSAFETKVNHWGIADGRACSLPLKLGSGDNPFAQSSRDAEAAMRTRRTVLSCTCDLLGLNPIVREMRTTLGGARTGAGQRRQALKERAHADPTAGNCIAEIAVQAWFQTEDSYNLQGSRVIWE